MEILFWGNRNNYKLLVDLLKKSNSRTEVVFAHNHLPEETLEKCGRVILDLTNLPGKTKEEKIKAKIGRNRGKEMMSRIEKKSDKRFLFYLSDFVLENSPNLEGVKGKERVFLYCVYGNDHRSLPLCFCHSKSPMKEALTTIVSGIQKHEIT